MSGEDLTDRGLSRGRRWSELGADEVPLAWSVDNADGWIQGPLALDFLRGRRLALTLTDGQLALLLDQGRVKAVFLAGEHDLEVGSGAHVLSPTQHLLFLAPGDGLELRWTPESPLRCGAEGQWSLIGNCRLEIEAPCAFHDTFLAGAEPLDRAFALALVDRLVQGAVAEHLSPASPGDAAWSSTEVQARLMRLLPEDLSDELAPCGLACRHLAVYTAHPPVDHERERERDVTASAAEPVPMSGHSEDLRRH